jgi:hypothetical protein
MTLRNMRQNGFAPSSQSEACGHAANFNVDFGLDGGRAEGQGGRCEIGYAIPMSLELFSAEEHQRLIDAESKYGNAFVNAYNSTILLSNLIMWPVVDCHLFIRFYSQMKKYHALSVGSTVRLHRVQAKMDLRYFLESTANAAFSLAHTDTKNYFDFDNNQLGDAQKATSKATNGSKRPTWLIPTSCEN